jgi:primosomal protein N' (replication factor Y)
MMIDLKREHQVSGLSQTARRAMSEVLATGQQVLLFLNRRGYAPVLECGECGYRSKCPGCETYLTVHRRAGQLMCHHCGYASRLPELCPECHHKTWKFQGVGTEKLEESLTDLFPEARVIRIDRSSMDQKDRLTMQLQQIHEGQVDIVIGTQMIAKGHHFKSLGLVIVLELDSGLFSPDYRAMEQSLQLLVQIAGRVGREGVGQVLIQTQQPDHPMLLKALQAPYEEVMEALLASRATARMPPYVYFAQIRYESQQPERPLAVLDELKLRLSPRISAWTGVQILGPALALHTKRAHYYRAHLLIVGDHRPALHQALDEMLALLPQKPPSTDRWTVDVDPLSVV